MSVSFEAFVSSIAKQKRGGICFQFVGLVTSELFLTNLSVIVGFPLLYALKGSLSCL